MPVYHFTFHAYRSWSPDHARGYARRDAGYVSPDRIMACHYDHDATQAPVTFVDELQHVLIEGARDICARRDWTLHGIACDPTHVHLLVSWIDDTLEWKPVHDTLKRLLGMMLSRHTGQQGRKWFVRKGSRKRVKDKAHFDHLVDAYFPKHKGRCWIAIRTRS